MASPFDAAMKAADNTIKRTFAEAVRIEPMVAARDLKPAAADVTRPVTNITAVVSLGSDNDRLQGVRKGTELNGMTTVEVSPSHVWMDAATYGGLGFELARGDVVRLLEQPGEPAFLVSVVRRTQLGDVTILLIASSRS